MESAAQGALTPAQTNSANRKKNDKKRERIMAAKGAEVSLVFVEASG